MFSTQWQEIKIWIEEDEENFWKMCGKNLQKDLENFTELFTKDLEEQYSKSIK